MNFPGYCVSLSGTYSQLVVTTSPDWEAGTFDPVTGTDVANADYMRMKEMITLASLATSSGGRPNTSTNGGYFCLNFHYLMICLKSFPARFILRSTLSNIHAAFVCSTAISTILFLLEQP